MAIILCNTHVEGEQAPVSSRAYAGSQYGDDGPANGPDPELLVGDLYGSAATRTAYDGSVGPDGTWTGWTRFRIDVNPGGGQAGVTIYDPAATPDTATYTGVTYGDVVAVTFSAYAGDADATAQFSDVQVVFLDQGQVVDQFTADSLPQAAAADDGTSDQAVFGIGTNVACDSAVVATKITYTVPPGTYPAPTDLSGMVYFDAYLPQPTVTRIATSQPITVPPANDGDDTSAQPAAASPDAEVEADGSDGSIADAVAADAAGANAATDGDVMDVALMMSDGYNWVVA